MLTIETCRSASPVFFSVNVWVAESVPTIWFPKSCPAEYVTAWLVSVTTQNETVAQEIALGVLPESALTGAAPPVILLQVRALPTLLIMVQTETLGQEE